MKKNTIGSDIVTLLVAVIIIALAMWIPSKVSAPTENYDPVLPKIERENLAGEKIDAYLSRLAFTYECTGSCAAHVVRDEPYRRVDSNGLYSYGCLQFQEATYLSKAKKYGIDPWQGAGIYDCDNQMAIAKAMFKEDVKSASRHWYNSVYTRGLGLPQL